MHAAAISAESKQKCTKCTRDDGRKFLSCALDGIERFLCVIFELRFVADKEIKTRAAAVNGGKPDCDVEEKSFSN